MTSTLPPTRARRVHYPESDGKPFESDLHRDLMGDLIFALKLFLKIGARMSRAICLSTSRKATQRQWLRRMCL
jgi:hypothetical protein